MGFHVDTGAEGNPTPGGAETLGFHVGGGNGIDGAVTPGTHVGTVGGAAGGVITLGFHTGAATRVGCGCQKLASSQVIGGGGTCIVTWTGGAAGVEL